MNRIDLDWSAVCRLDDILPDTGVCALVKQRAIAVFRVAGAPESLYAIDNYDPNSRANVLSRGLVGSLGGRVVVASPIFKQHFDLASGECIEAPHNSVTAYPVRLADGQVLVAV
ncbi:MAG: nitrite reductase small subunit NirD [Haliea sp.]|nr:MAG: nitrite reductase small subunit NirD [Haliea sp.]